MFGVFVDKADGVTLKTDATTITDIDHATTGIFLSKNGVAAAIRHQNVTASVADAYGMMKVTLDTTDTATVGTLDVLFAKAATYLPVHKTFMVLPANVYDSLMGTDLLDVNAAQWLGTAIVAPAVAGTPDVNAKQIGGTAQTGNDVGADVNEILIDTAVIGALGAGLTAIASQASVDAVKSDTGGIVTDVAATHVHAAGAETQATAAAADVVNIDGAAMRGTDSAALASSWTAALATVLANYTAARAGYLDNVNQAGLLQVTAARAALLDQITALRLAELDAANIPADIDTIKGYLDTEVAAIKAKTDLIPADVASIPTSTELDAAHGAGSWEGGGAAPSAAVIADAVWDELIADHLGVGATGQALDDAGAAGLPPTVGEIDTELTAKHGAGSWKEGGGGGGYVVASDIWSKQDKEKLQKQIDEILIALARKDYLVVSQKVEALRGIADAILEAVTAGNAAESEGNAKLATQLKENVSVLVGQLIEISTKLIEPEMIDTLGKSLNGKADRQDIQALTEKLETISKAFKETLAESLEQVTAALLPDEILEEKVINDKESIS